MKKFCFFALVILVSCKTTRKTPASESNPAPFAIAGPRPLPQLPIIVKKSLANTDRFLEDLLKSRPEKFDSILNNRDSLNVQVIYTQINRKTDNTPVLKSYYFNVDSERYFYPASTVKLPVAALALQRLHELQVEGLTKTSTMITERADDIQTPVYNDPATPDGRPNIASYIKKIFLASDNDAFNRLYEFLGQQYINRQLHAMRYPRADLLHRLALSLSEMDNRRTNPVSFFDEQGRFLFGQRLVVSPDPYPRRNESVGNAYVSASGRVNRPMSFDGKNRLQLDDLNRMLKSIIFPAQVDDREQFRLTLEDRSFLLQYMSEFPRESLFPAYDSAKTWDAAGKFLLFGAGKEPIPAHIRIFNKIGGAYGFLTDVAYIVDFKNKVEFMLSATIYCNRDGVLNDDLYDYEGVGFPFLKNLGQLVYEYELGRPRLNTPDLSAFHFNYQKN